jgi:ParB family chromosome partitioning protein
VKTERRLGRGLAALLGSPLFEEPAQASGQAANLPATADSFASAAAAPTRSVSEGEVPNAAADGGLLHLPVGDIQENPFQPRRDFSEQEIASLAESLKTHDMLQPVLVRRLEGRYQLISGERRLRAARLAGWQTIPARVRDADDRLVAELAIVENLQRQDLNPIEKALSFKRYLDEHKCTQDDLAKRLKIDRSTIANLMRLLELPASVLDSLRTGAITAGHARALLPLGDEPAQTDFCQRIVADGLSVRDVERLVSEQLVSLEGDDPDVLSAGTSRPAARRARNRSEQVTALEQELRLALGTKIEISQTAKGRGKIVIHFDNADEFERIHAQLTDATGGLRRAA